MAFLLLVDCERPEEQRDGQAYSRQVADLIASLIACTAGSGSSSLPFLALANGAHLRMFAQNEEMSVSKWAMAMAHIRECLASSSIPAEPGIAALSLVPAEVLQRIDRIAFVTPLGGKSCHRGVVRHALDQLARSHIGCEFDLVLLLADDEPRAVAPATPTELLLLQGEHNLSVHLLDDSIAVASWVRSRIAQQQAVSVELQFCSHGMYTSTLALATPALLHDAPVCDVHACVCHGAPLHARPMGGGASSLAKAAAEAGATCFLSDAPDPPFPLEIADPSPPLPRVEAVERRLKVEQLSLSSLFGSAWLLETQPDGANADGLSYDGGTPTSHGAAEASAILAALSAQLDGAGETLLCRCTLREHFEDEWLLPPNFASLLQPYFLLLPQTPHTSPLLLKSIASAAHVVPRTQSRLDDNAFVQAAAQRANTLLSAVPLSDGLNPLLHCTASGGTQMLQRLLNTAPAASPSFQTPCGPIRTTSHDTESFMSPADTSMGASHALNAPLRAHGVAPPHAEWAGAQTSRTVGPLAAARCSGGRRKMQRLTSVGGKRQATMFGSDEE
ncbi:hypothetical protein AB1Y20_005370 [Prymnesium parvum]|uniref:Uncharacterized protein n=1 Tax=Prymnesium parvum TaxID=97485 RepID=A0AB34J6B4_PRYPA